MFGNNFNPYGYNPTTHVPTTVPYTQYGHPNYQGQFNQQTSAPATNTNKIFVSGLEDARTKVLPPNSDYIFLDNDKAMLYQKIVDGNGHFTVKVFDILPHKDEPQSTDSNYVLKSEFLALQNELIALKERLAELNVKKEVINNEPVEQSDPEQ